MGEQHLRRLTVDLAECLAGPTLVMCRPSSHPLSMLGVTPEWPPGVRRSISSTTSSNVQFRASRARRNGDGSSTTEVTRARGITCHLLGEQLAQSVAMLAPFGLYRQF